MMPRWILALVAAAAVASCATATRLEAAGDVHALLVSIHDNDRAGFDAHIDRSALKAQLSDALLAKAQKSAKSSGLGPLADMLAQPMADVAANQLLQPKVFQFAARQFGYDPNKALPDRLAISSALRNVDDQTVCAAKTKSSPCILIFRKTEGVWRLSGFGPDAGVAIKGH